MNTIIAKILEEGGRITWKKYILEFESNRNVNPNIDWEGYVIDKLDGHMSYTNIHKSMNINEILEYFYRITQDNDTE